MSVRLENCVRVGEILIIVGDRRTKNDNTRQQWRNRLRSNNKGNDVTGELTSTGQILEHARGTIFRSLSEWTVDAVKHFFPKESTSLNGWDHVAVKRGGQEKYLTDVREDYRRSLESAPKTKKAPKKILSVKSSSTKRPREPTIEQAIQEDEQIVEPPSSRPRVVQESPLPPSPPPLPSSSKSAQRPRLSRVNRNKVWVNCQGDVMHGECRVCSIELDFKKGWHGSHINCWIQSEEMDLHILTVLCNDCNIACGTRNILDLLWSCERTDRHERDGKIIDIVRKSKQMFLRECTREEKEYWKTRELQEYARFVFGNRSRGGIQNQGIYEVLGAHDTRRFNLIILHHNRKERRKLAVTVKKRISVLEKMLNDAKKELDSHSEEFERHNDSFKDNAESFKKDFDIDFDAENEMSMSDFDDDK